jgi:hypothetical protein
LFRGRSVLRAHHRIELGQPPKVRPKLDDWMSRTTGKPTGMIDSFTSTFGVHNSNRLEMP